MKRIMTERHNVSYASRAFIGDDELGRPLYDWVYGQLLCFIEPQDAVNTVGEDASTIYSIALSTQQAKFTPDKDWITGETTALSTYIWWNNEWFQPTKYVDYTNVTFGNHKIASFIDDSSTEAVVPINPPAFIEIDLFSKAVNRLEMAMKFKIEPAFTLT